MAKCSITGKKQTFGNNVSHSHTKTNRTFKVNMKKVKAIVNGTPKRIWVSTSALKSGLVERAR